MAAALSTAISSLISAAGSVFTMATDPNGMLPYFLLSIGCAAILTGVGIVKRLVWGA